MLEHWSPALNEALNTFLLDGKARRFTARTLEHYKTRLGGFFVFCESHNVGTIAEITPSLIRLYYPSRRKKPIKSYGAHLRKGYPRILNFCVREELLSKSPVRTVAMPQRDKTIPDYLTVDEVQRLLDACETERESMLILVMLDTGLRATEACSLNIGHSDLSTLPAYLGIDIDDLRRAHGQHEPVDKL